MLYPHLMFVVEAIKRIFIDAVRTSLVLFRIMIPIIIVVKILKELGWIAYLAVPLEPIMTMVGLPAKTGLVWATAMANTLYAAIIVYAALIPEMPELTTAQVTVLCTMMLIAHSLPLEGNITRKCGAGLWSQVVFRIACAMICGTLMNLIFTWGGWLQGPSHMVFTAAAEADSWLGWAWAQVVKLFYIFCIILTLMTVMRILRKLRITDLFAWLLSPVLKLTGIGKEAAMITVFGLTMGLAYGGGLILHEVETGLVSRKDVFASLSLMGLAHALIEDSMLMALMGGAFVGIFWGRLAFALVAVAILIRLMNSAIGRKPPLKWMCPPAPAVDQTSSSVRSQASSSSPS